MRLFIKIALIIFITGAGHFMVYAQTPQIQPKTNIVLHVDATGNLHILPTDVADITTTAATSPISSVSPDNFTCSSLGQQTLTVTASDGAGNTATANVIVTVAADPPAVMTKPGPITLALDATGNYTVKPEDVIVVMGCGPAPAIQVSPASFNCSTLGIQIVTATVNITNSSAVSFSYPNSLAFNTQGNLYVADAGNSAIRKITPDGTTTTLPFVFPGINGITTDTIGNINVADGNQLKEIKADGTLTILAGSTVPGDVDGPGATARFNKLYMGAVDASGNIYVADYFNSKIKKISPAGVVTTMGTVPNGPISLALDGAGNVFTTTFGSSRVIKVTPAGTVSTFAGSISGYENGPGTVAQFLSPVGIAQDLTGGNFYITDTGNNKIRRVAPDGTVSTIAGGSTMGHLDGPGLSATFNHPEGMAIDKLGNLYVVDQSLIRKIAPDGTVSTFAGTEQPGFVDGKIDESNITVPVTFKIPVTVVNLNPPPTISVTASAAIICPKTPVTFTATAGNAGNAPSYQWKINGTNAGQNSPQFTTSDLNDGDLITCTVTSSANCSVAVTSIPVPITVFPQPTILLDNLTIEKGSSVQLSPVVTGNVNNYSWSPATGLSSTAIANPIANPENTTIYTLTVTTAGNCTATKQVTINVVSTIIIPNTFTPNNDGTNDLWEIPALANYPDCTVDIYNRYGEQLYHSIGYAKSWDGNYKNRPLPVGTYYYVINPNKKNMKLLTGYIAVLR